MENWNQSTSYVKSCQYEFLGVDSGYDNLKLYDSSFQTDKKNMV